MSLHERLSEDLKEAMRAKDQLRMDTIRLIKAAILNKELELKKSLDDTELTRVMSALVKQRKEAVEQYQKANRADLASKELKEIAIIESYVPKGPSPDELVLLVEATIQEVGASSMKEMGTVMKAVMAKLMGRPVDGKLINDLVRARLR